MHGVSRTFQASPDPHDGRLACVDCHDTNDVNQSMNSYARRCSDCHNDHYGQLAYQWAQSLQRRQTVVERMMLSRDGASSKQVREDLSQAMECGFHNLHLTRRLYDHIMETLQSTESETGVPREGNMP